MSDAMGTRACLLGLPTELICHILSSLDIFDLVSTAKTCRVLHVCSCDDQIWQAIVNRHVHAQAPITSPAPCATFHQLYAAHHPYWFLPSHHIWFADTDPSGKLLIARFNPVRGSIEAHAVTARRRKTDRTHDLWEHDRNVAIINFDPVLSLDLNLPVVNLEVRNRRTVDHRSDQNGYPSDRGYAPPSLYSRETLMDTFAEAGLYSSFALCRNLPQMAISEGTRVWPPLRLPSDGRARQATSDGFHSAGHRPTRFDEISQSNFRLRKWVEYTGRRNNPNSFPFSSPNGLSAALGIGGPYFASGIISTGGSMSIRMPEDITTYATLPPSAYTPTKQKPWQGIWVGDYGGHGCEFLVIVQPDKETERPLPSGLDYLREWFAGIRRESMSSSSTYESALEETPEGEDTDADLASHVSAGYMSDYDPAKPVRPDVDYRDAPSGRLEAIKLTGDPHIPRGEHTFIAPDIGHGGFVRIADEEPFRGARVVRSAGHIAANGFHEDQYTPSQLIMISHDCLAQFWEGFGHISYFRRVDLTSLIRTYAADQVETEAEG